ncbi:MAG: cupin domain-containing protein [Acidimicrobiales bacterium]|nr:cupin domain-containing protein [Acidimicrobiales bacterium]
MTVTHLADLLSPVPVEDFLVDGYGCRPFLVRGDPDRYEGLFPWSRLNTLIRERHLDWFRSTEDGVVSADAITLSRQGRIRHSPSVDRTVDGEYSIDRSRSRQLDPVRLNHELRSGSTLLVRHLDKVHEPLARLAEGLERDLDEPIMVRAFATWKAVQGFGPHCDRYDTLVMQLEGTKQWRLFGPDPLRPLMGDGDHSGMGEAETQDELVLEPGDLLYVPQGWWHEAVTVDTPCLHLTADVYQRSGVDLVNWVTRNLARHPEFRADLPPESDPVARAAHLDRLRHLALADWDDAVVDRFLADTRVNVRPQRATMSLPWSATRDVLPLGQGLMVRMINPRRLQFDQAVDPSCDTPSLVVRTQGQTIRIDAARAKLLEPLLDGDTVSVDQVAERDPSARDLLVDWLLAGHLTVTDQDDEVLRR